MSPHPPPRARPGGAPADWAPCVRAPGNACASAAARRRRLFKHAPTAPGLFSGGSQNNGPRRSLRSSSPYCVTHWLLDPLLRPCISSSRGALRAAAQASAYQSRAPAGARAGSRAQVRGSAAVAPPLRRVMGSRALCHVPVPPARACAAAHIGPAPAASTMPQNMRLRAPPARALGPFVGPAAAPLQPPPPPRCTRRGARGASAQPRCAARGLRTRTTLPPLPAGSPLPFHAACPICVLTTMHRVRGAALIYSPPQPANLRCACFCIESMSGLKPTAVRGPHAAPRGGAPAAPFKGAVGPLPRASRPPPQRPAPDGPPRRACLAEACKTPHAAKAPPAPPAAHGLGPGRARRRPILLSCPPPFPRFGAGFLRSRCRGSGRAAAGPSSKPISTPQNGVPTEWAPRPQGRALLLL
jgi:hypothetical protein